MRIGKRTQIYWLSQLTGWGLFVLGNIISASIQAEVIPGLYIVSLFILINGILVTHIFRNMVVKLQWASLNIPQLIPRMLLSSILMSLAFTLFNTILTDLLSGNIPLLKTLFTATFGLNALNFTALFLLWEIIYFAVHTFENWKKEEILNLELRAAKTEIELNSLRAQMNPHFVFNSMNSIRALVDENPEKAKAAITMLSGILRGSLTMGRFQTIPLRQEFDLVEKYIALEKIRFEERLEVNLHVVDEVLDAEVPPFVVQTLVENAIKHGISTKIEGGRISIQAKVEGNHILITIANTGSYMPKENHDGIGISNIRTRLEMIFGNNAEMNIRQSGNEVIVQLRTPIKYKP
ncbi:MAG: histidine kinase [Flavobacteriales bacterium]|nr:histidine kinase [Flavobacteriales bacterium]